MICSFTSGSAASAALLLLALPIGLAPAVAPPQESSNFPYPEKLSYRIEWRMVTAGNAVIQLSRPAPDDWNVNIHLQSAGLVTHWFRVVDTYKADLQEQFCGSNSMLDAQEGKRHTITRLTFENMRHKVDYEEHDLLKNSTVKDEVTIAPCTYEIIGALDALRKMDLQPGKSATLPITNGKKLAYGKIDAQVKETINVAGKTYRAIRCEAFLFDNVLYKRKGRLFVWMTDDPDHLPVQLRMQLAFPIGTITVELEKHERS
jgi:hypothetical protein